MPTPSTPTLTNGIYLAPSAHPQPQSFTAPIFPDLYPLAFPVLPSILSSMRGWHYLIGAVLVWGGTGFADNLVLTDDQPLRLPPVGASQLRILSPTLLELTLVTTKSPDPAPVRQWDFVEANGQPRIPAPEKFLVSANRHPIAVSAVGFRRRVLYAPFRHRDLRIGNYLYLQLASPVLDNQTVEVKNPRNDLWPDSVQFVAAADPLRWSPLLHVNQTGYIPDYPKEAMVGYYLGSLGEMSLTGAASNRFNLLDARSGKVVFQGALTPRPDRGFPSPCYQEVLEADFSNFKTPGEYRLCVPTLGTSYPFRIDSAVAGAFARTYALGIYHQRCGESNALPFTRFTHDPCHTAPAEVPDVSAKYASVNHSLEKESADFRDNPRHTAPQLRNVDASLYPFVNRGPIDVSGGHHDAGDYSKYTINSASFIHQLVFAADVFPGVAELDNLGLPESGDGKSDILQEAKNEADFLAKMQDADGGFYFLVYPRDREYEDNVTPDHGDPQIVFPKTTAVTAAATAALAQCASSPVFKREFPQSAALYLTKARKGWDFLELAIAKFGKDGSYQKITHYGNEFMHDDELAWAACEMFLATRDESFHKKLLEWLNPTDPGTRKWGWWRLYDAYGCAIRSYAFAAKSGRIQRDQQNLPLLEECEAEIAAAGQDQLRRAQSSAYGTSFPEETKRAGSAGWYFSGDAAFDLAVACQLDYPAMNDPRSQMLAALVENLNYEQGCNPVNVTYVTGLGWKRQREIVDQYAQNSRRVLPPSGIPLGNIQTGFGWLDLYQKELEEMSFPSDGATGEAYPFYDRWGDSFNLSQEFVTVNQARSLGYLAWLMAQTPLKKQPWKPAAGTISRTGNGTSLMLSAPGLDLSEARIVWEAQGDEPIFCQDLKLSKSTVGPSWVEVEAQFPDGRRVFAMTNSVGR